MTRVVTMAAVGLASILAAISTASAAEPNGQTKIPQKDRETCISLRLLEQTQIIDDFTIVYRLRGDRYYRNTLMGKCTGLFQQGNFMFQLTNPYRICRGDFLTVFKLSSGCRLGYFDPITKAELARLQYNAYAQRKADNEKSRND